MARSKLRRAFMGTAYGTGDMRPLRFIATRGRVADARATNFNKQYMSRTWHYASDDIGTIQVRVGNFCWDKATFAFLGTGGTATVEMSVEYPAGTFTRLQCNGSNSAVIADFGTADFTASGLSIPTGSQFWVREYRVTTGGITYLQSANGDASDVANGDAFEYGASITNKVMGGTVASSDISAPRNQAFPLAIIGRTNKVAILLAGDSRCRGAFDTYDASGDSGELARSIGPSFAYVNFGCFGAKLSDINSAPSYLTALLPFCTDVVSQLGINDIRGNANLATMQSRYATFFALFAGKRVSQGTLTPSATSTDQFQTLVNQTAMTQSANRINTNTWLRTKPSPLTNYFEIADQLESSRNSGLIKVDGTSYKYVTSDGLHWTQAGFLLIPAGNAIPSSAFPAV